MSEYPYSDWQTLDRPLIPQEQAAVNKLSSHMDVASSRADLQARYASRAALRLRLQRAYLL